MIRVSLPGVGCGNILRRTRNLCHSAVAGSSNVAQSVKMSTYVNSAMSTDCIRVPTPGEDCPCGKPGL